MSITRICVAALAAFAFSGSIAAAATSTADTEVAALEAEVAHASHDLQLLKSREAILNLQTAYGYYIDKGKWNEAASLFSSDGSYEFGQRGVYVGPEHIKKALALMGPEGLQQGQLNDYPMLQPIIDVAPDNKTAKARWRSDVMLAKNGKGEWAAGTYENEYVNDNGTWKISKLHYYVTFIGGYQKGWIEDPHQMAGESKEFPPDHPPTVVYKALPDVNMIPYHYGNPVTTATPSIEHPVHGKDLPADLAAVEQSANALAHKVELLKDHADIEKLQRAYGYYVDKAQWPDISHLFADDGTYEIGGRGVFIGPKRVLEYLVTGLGPIGVKTRHGGVINHQQFEGIVNVAPDGKTAAGRWTAFVVAGMAKTGSAWGDCTYENTYVKVNGVWKAKSIRGPFNMYAPYKGGWKDHAIPNTRPDSFPPPPDLPPTTVYLTYPSFYNAPFHYRNFVTGKPAPAPNPAAGGAAPMSNYVKH